jgi:chromosomal replication initiation ATPase DnaA
MYFLNTAGDVCLQPTASTPIHRERDVIRVASEIYTPRQRRMMLVAKVAEQHGCTVADIMGKQRRHKEARWEAWLAVQQEFGDGFAPLGRLFKRDHTSIMHGLRQVQS